MIFRKTILLLIIAQSLLMLVTNHLVAQSENTLSMVGGTPKVNLKTFKKNGNKYAVNILKHRTYDVTVYLFKIKDGFNICIDNLKSAYNEFTIEYRGIEGVFEEFIFSSSGDEFYIHSSQGLGLYKSIEIINRTDDDEYSKYRKNKGDFEIIFNDYDIIK